MRNEKCKSALRPSICNLQFAICNLHLSPLPHPLTPSPPRLVTPSRHSRRGSIYLIVLAAASIVATLGMGAMLAVRAQARAVNSLGDAAEARQYALSAVEIGRLWIAQDPNWRTNRSCGAWASGQPIGSGTFTLEVSDPVDGNLANRPHDPVVFKATGVKGQARQVVQVTLTANPVPLPALQYALVSSGRFTFSGLRSLPPIWPPSRPTAT